MRFSWSKVLLGGLCCTGLAWAESSPLEQGSPPREELIISRPADGGGLPGQGESILEETSTATGIPLVRTRLDSLFTFLVGPENQEGKADLSEAEDTTSIPSRFSIRQDFGNGVGYRRGYTYVEGFVPLFQPGTDSLVFGDVRAVNFEDSSRWEFNAGGGYRTYLCPLGAVLGINSFYDGRHTDTNFFHQIGVGFEALSPRWEFRCNGYFVVGDSRQQAGEVSILVPQGNNFILNRTQTFDVAMSGLDAEVGTPIPYLERWYTRAYVGYYHYSGETVPTTNGIRGRLETQLTRAVSLHFSAQNDHVFNTTINGGLAIHFGAGAYRNGHGLPILQDILGQRVVRDVNIVIDQSTATSTQFIPGPPPPPPQGGEEEEQR